MSQTPNYGLYVTDNSRERVLDVREALYGTENSNMTKIDAALGEKANSSVVVNAVLTRAGWSDGAVPYVQTLLIEGLTSAQNGIISVASSATTEQRDIVRDAMLFIQSQGEGTLTIGADGDRPTADIPVTIILLD